MPIYNSTLSCYIVPTQTPVQSYAILGTTSNFIGLNTTDDLSVYMGKIVYGDSGTAHTIVGVINYDNINGNDPGIFVYPNNPSTTFGLNFIQYIYDGYCLTSINNNIIYINIDGNDYIGDGSINNPLLTAQMAFQLAYFFNGNIVLDFGAGNFGTVNLNDAEAIEWPSRIAIRGAGYNHSFLTMINGNGYDQIWDYDNNIDLVSATNGKSISIISDNSINLGNISSKGGDISVYGANGRSGASITLNNSICNNIISDGGFCNGGNGGGAGTIILNHSESNNINANGGAGDYGGVAGAVNIIASRCNNIYTYGGGGGYGNGPNGSVTIQDGIVNNVVGDTTLVGYSNIPDTINGNLDSTNLYKGSSINGSNLLGVA